MPKKSRIAIIECCDTRFSKVVDYWPNEPVLGKKICFELYSGQGWSAYVERILPRGHVSNPLELDAIFMRSQDEALFYCLCDCIGKYGWFEGNGACDGLPKREDKCSNL